MINKDEIAVCVVGLAGPGYEEVLDIAKKVFPFDTFHMQWKGYDKPNVDPLVLFDEPQYDYHNLLDTQYKPDCAIWKRYTKQPGGKLFRREGLLAKTKHNSKQTLAHYWLVNTLPDKYKTIIKLRYDTLLSQKVDFMPLLEKAQQGTVVGIAGSKPGYDIDTPLRVHSYKDCRRCTGPYVWDHLIFHPRHKLKNVEKEFKNKNLMGAEWGWYQILNLQWGDNDYINVEGGNVLTKHRQ